MKLESGEAKKGNKSLTDYESNNKHITNKSNKSAVEEKDYSDGFILCLMREIVRTSQQSDSFMVCDSSSIRRAYAKWTDTFAPIKPSFEVFWNSSPEVLRLLMNLGCRHFRCRNRDEVRTALSAGVEADSISFLPAASPAVASHLKFARANGVKEFGFEGENDLTKISLRAPASKVLLVLKPCQKILSREELYDLMAAAKSLELEVTGAVVREEEEDVTFLCKAIAQAKIAFDIGKQAGHHNMRTLDLGSIVDVTPEAFSIISECLQGHFGSSWSSPTLTVAASWSSGGMVSDSASLCARVIGKRAYENDKGEAAFTYVLNDGIFGSFSKLLLQPEAALQVAPLNDRAACKVYRTDAWGCSGDDLDVLARGLFIPEVDVGEWLVFGGMGAGVVNPSASSAFVAYEARPAWAGDDRKDDPLWVVTHCERKARSNWLSSSSSSSVCEKMSVGPATPSSILGCDLDELLHDMTSMEHGEIA